MDFDKTDMSYHYKDAEEILDSKKFAQLINNLADFYAANNQRANKGKLLAHYKSAGLFRAYIDVYESAVVGRMKNLEGKTVNVAFGYADLAEAKTKGKTIYFEMKFKEIYRIGHLKMAERIAFQINGQKIRAMKRWNGE